MLSCNLAEECLKSLYDLKGSCAPLKGYTEYNYKVSAEDGGLFVLKIIEEDNWNEQEWEFQSAVLDYLKSSNAAAPQLIRTKNQLPNGAYLTFRARLLTWQEGNLLADLPFFSPSILTSLAQLAAKNIQELQNFRHPYADRPFHWNSDQGLWTSSYLNLFEDHEKDLISFFLEGFKSIQNQVIELPKSIIHNDLNEFNLLYQVNNYIPRVESAIDYGDACLSSRINNLAIPLSYMLQREADSLKVIDLMVSEFNKTISITREEIYTLYHLVGIRLVISVTQSRIAQKADPDNAYLPIHYKSSISTLKKLRSLGQSLVTSVVFSACDTDPEDHVNWRNWALHNPSDLQALFPEVSKSECTEIDLGLESVHTPHEDNPYYEDDFAVAVQRYQDSNHEHYIIGGYGEIRNLYTTEAFAQESFGTQLHRTKHLGIDIWEPAGTRIASPWDGKIALVHKTDAHKDYGTVIVVRYPHNDGHFYLLFGHLSSKSYDLFKVGDTVKKGATVGWLGTYEENGHWVPHLHLQVILDLLGKGVNFDGVARPDQWHFMSNICPDPALLFPQLKSTKLEISKNDLLKQRKSKLGYGLSLSYRDPLWIKRGKGCYLVNHLGQTYLDTVNNVAHVGHENYQIVTAAKHQLTNLNTNTRYLSSHIVEYAEELLKTLPSELCVVHFTNSGSEANELALRMAETFSKRKEMLAIEVGYHGNTGRVIDVSSYKFDAEGGSGQPKNTHLLPIPDELRGQFVRNVSQKNENYTSHAVSFIKELNHRGIKLAGFIHESILSCGGQIVLPEGYLQPIYETIRGQGGICIADEVQVGFGRVGKHFWGFELQNVVPDIVVLGKPIGNGHPMGAVVCTHEVASVFNNGMEYFNTFGGNPVSARVGIAVLEEIHKKRLQENAWHVGSYIKKGLKHLQEQFPIIAEVRGYGLFLGIEFLDEFGKPDAPFTSAFAECMLSRKILTSVDGPDHNVIKIKPPITFSLKHADILLRNTREILGQLSALRS